MKPKNYGENKIFILKGSAVNIYVNTCLKVIVAHPLLKVTFLVSMNKERPKGKKYISWQVIPDKLMNLNEEDAKISEIKKRFS